MMPRYIDADKLTQKLRKWQNRLIATYGINDEYVKCLGDVLDNIEDTPTVDLTPEFMKHYCQGLHDAELKRTGELMQSFDPD